MYLIVTSLHIYDKMHGPQGGTFEATKHLANDFSVATHIDITVFNVDLKTHM